MDPPTLIAIEVPLEVEVEETGTLKDSGVQQKEEMTSSKYVTSFAATQHLKAIQLRSPHITDESNSIINVSSQSMAGANDVNTVPNTQRI